MVRLVGVDHVGLGSDFDGVGDSLPTGLKDVSDYPNLIRELLRADYVPEGQAPVESLPADDIVDDGRYDQWVRAGSKHPASGGP